VGLALAWNHMASNSFTSYAEGHSNMEAAVTRALELAPGLAEAHLVLGQHRFFYRQDLAGSHAAFNTALELNPGNVDVQIDYARINCYQGFYDEAIAAARKAVELDPVSLLANHFLGHILYFSRRYEQAIPALRHTLEMEPRYPKPHFFIALSLFWLGRPEEAWVEIQQEPLDWMRWTASAMILHRLGRVAEAESNLAELNREEDEEFATIQRADVHAQWGETELAFKNLELAMVYGDPGLSQLRVDPCLDPIRDDPRFVAIMEKLGFENTQTDSG
jgi:tetratricopeptide (TPR) repeat protein